MTDKEKIRKFLEGMANADCCVTQVAKVINKIILPYIDSLQEEPVSEDLEAEIHNKIMMLHTAPCYDELADVARHFAEWQKQQIMKGFPTWKRSGKLIEGALLDRGILYIPRYMIELSELKKLPKED